jgi:hypothetical protein
MSGAGHYICNYALISLVMHPIYIMLITRLRYWGWPAFRRRRKGRRSPCSTTSDSPIPGPDRRYRHKCLIVQCPLAGRGWREEMHPSALAALFSRNWWGLLGPKDITSGPTGGRNVSETLTHLDHIGREYTWVHAYTPTCYRLPGSLHEVTHPVDSAPGTAAGTENIGAIHRISRAHCLLSIEDVRMGSERHSLTDPVRGVRYLQVPPRRFRVIYRNR